MIFLGIEEMSDGRESSGLMCMTSGLNERRVGETFGDRAGQKLEDPS